MLINTVTPKDLSWWWWQPWANTLAYYPLTSDFDDYSNIWANLTNSWWVITTVDGVSCAYYNWSSYSINASLPYLTNTRTISCWRRPASTSNVMWIVVTWYNSGTYEIRWLQQSSWVIWGSERVTLDQSVNSWVSVTVNNWYYLVTTIENWVTAKIYVNWELKNTLTRTTPIIASSWLTIWSKSWVVNSEKANWYVSNAIIEDIVRTAQEISDYYNQTKADYGIS